MVLTLCQASVTDLNAELDKARAKSSATRGVDPADTLRDLLFKLPGGGSETARELDSIERIRAGPTQGGKPPDQLSPQEMHAVLWQVLTFRDSGKLCWRVCNASSLIARSRQED